MIEGMQNVVVTVTGYTGIQRMKLIKLISHTGANYVGKMTKSNTHLICWNFEGKKYQLAQECGILIVNHKWLEDCVKEGKRIPEFPYTMQSSGQEIGFNIPDLSDVSETAGMLSENKGLLNKPSIQDFLNDVITLDSDEIVNWGKDPLLNENSPPRPRSREAARQSSKKILIKGTLRHDRRAKEDIKRATHEPQTPTVDGYQCEISDFSPKSTTKQRRSNSDKSIRMGSDVAEPSHRNRRLVKKNANTCTAEVPTIDVEQQRSHEDVNENTIASNVSNNSTDRNIEIEANIDRRVETISAAHHERTDDEINYMNNLDPIVEISLHDDDTLNAEGRNMKEISPDIQILNGDKCERDQRTVVPSSDLSCVICWTEFSSTRGVLPCGHRFCFSCIQSWADHKASERKASTCPLCKADFKSITRVDATASSDQKIYSQTIPCPSSSQDIIYVPEGRSYQSNVEITRTPVCCHCHSQAPAEFLRYCQHCQSSCIHEYCLDPPLFPWTCFRCRDYRYFFRH